MTWTRRRLLQTLGATAGAGLLLRGTAAADASRPLQESRLDCGRYKILEIFMYGGFSHRETLWIEQPDAAPVWRQLSYITPTNWTSEVSALTSLPSSPWTHPLASNVHLGPCALPLAGHPLGSRLRLVATGHGLAPHEAAAALTLTGLPLGRTRGSGLGTVIQRRYGTEQTPASWVVGPSSAATPWMLQSGVHGAANQPILLPMSSTLTTLLQRGGVGTSYRTATDDLLAFYESRYSQRLSYPGGGARSAGHDAYATALRRLIGAPQIQALLASGPPLVPSLYTACHRDHVTYSGQAIEVASYLLSAGGARYVGVIDQPSSTPGLTQHDSHYAQNEYTIQQHALHANRNVFYVLQALQEQVDAGALDLSTTLVVLRSEFGRKRDDTSIGGTNHHPAGYPTLMLGGPLSGATVAGAMDLTDGHGKATGGPSGLGFSPTDLRAALLIAAGIDPFDPDCLLPSETSMATADADTARDRIVQHVLGLSPGLLDIICPIEPPRENL